MNVLMISDYADPTAKVGSKRFGGISVYIKNLSTHLAKNGIQVDIFTPQQGESDKQVHKVNPNLRYITIPAGPGNSFKQEILNYIYFNNLSYDVIHSNYWFAGVTAIDLAKKLKLPQVHIFHSNGKIRLEFLKEAGLDKTDSIIKTRINAETQIARTIKNIIAASPIEKSTLKNTYGIEKKNIEIIPIGVDTDIFKPMNQKTARRALGISNSSKIIIFVGRIDENKGVTILLQSMPAIIAKYPQVKLLLVGGEKSQNQVGSEVYELKKLAKELKIAASIIFVGQVDQEDLSVYYSAADVCAVPSFYETFGIVPLESMACTTPVVASQTGGLVFTVKDDISGYLTKPKDPIDLSKKIMQVFEKGKNYFAPKCLSEVKENFLWENIAQEYIRSYKQAINKFRKSYPQKQFAPSATISQVSQWKSANPLKGVLSDTQNS